MDENRMQELGKKRVAEIKMGDMIRIGIIMNLIGVVLITLLTFLLGTVVFDIGLGALPEWAL